MKNIFSKRVLATVLALTIAITLLPTYTLAATPGTESLYNSLPIKALQYLGYDAKAQYDNGTFLQKGTYDYQTPANILSNISYNAGGATGLETTSANLPNVSAFESKGLCCASFISYYILNYLPNIEGVKYEGIHEAIAADDGEYRSSGTWKAALTSLASQGKAKQIDLSEAKAGDIVFFDDGTANKTITHIAIYLGKYTNGFGKRNFIVHCGSSRGPDISTIEGLTGPYATKTAYLNSIYRLKEPVQYGTIEVKKTDGNGKNLSGAMFAVYDANGNEIKKIGPTDANGYASVEDVPYGTYSVVETVTPENYIKGGPWTVTVSETNNGKVTLNAVNTIKKGSIEVHKTDGRGNNLAGAVFTATDLNNTSLTYQIGPTDANGYAKTENIPYGTYQVRETVVPDGYNKTESSASGPWTVEINDTVNGEISIDCVNLENDGNLIITKTVEGKTNEYVSDIMFILQGTSDKGTPVYKHAITDENGKATFTGIPVGTYTLSEIEATVPEYCEVMAEKTVVVGYNEETNITVDNTYKKGTVEVIKTADDNVIEGVCFILSGTADNGEKVNRIVFTDENGKATFLYVPVGTYTLTEKNGADRYVAYTDREVTVNWNETTTEEVHNTLKKWKLVVNKFDKNHTSVASGEGTLEGAKYGIYKDGQLVDEYVTDENGVFTTKEYEAGTGYTLKEISAPTGYLISTTEHSLDEQVSTNVLTDKTTSVTYYIYEIPITNHISIKKYTDDANDVGNFTIAEEGAEFVVYLKSLGKDASKAKADEGFKVYDTCKVDATGNAVWESTGTYESAKLEYGTYTVEQISGWEGRVLAENFDVVIDSVSKEYSYTLNNPVYYTTFKVEKYDATSSKLIIDSPATFKILNKDTNKYVTYTEVYPELVVVEEFKTVNGIFELPVNIGYGNYELIEVSAPDGYILDSTPIPFSVTENTDGIVLKVNNAPKTGKVEISKTGLQFTSVSTEESEYGTVNTPKFTETYLANVEFSIIANEDIVRADGTVVYNKGDVVEVLTTNSTAPVVSSELFVGNYKVVETKGVNGYKIDTTEYEIEIKGNDDGSIEIVKLDFTNERTKTSIDLEKIATKWKSSTEDQEIAIKMMPITREVVEVAGEGFTFGLYANEDFATVDASSVITKDSLVVIGVTNEEGKLVFNSDVPFGKYYVKELDAPEEHFNIIEDKFEVDLTATTTDGTPITVSLGEIKNDFDRFDIVITKTDLVTSEPVVGAVVEIKDATDTILYRATTSEDGTLPNIVLEAGDYTFTEVVAPIGYIKNTTVFEFTVNEDGTVDGVVDFTNEPTRVTITKTDLTTAEPIADAEITIYDEDGEVVYQEMTDENGQVTAFNLSIGEKYTFKETISPNGYAINTAIFTFEIDEEGNVIGDTEVVDDLTRFNIYKVNENDKPMADVEFTMYDENGNAVTTVVTDENGVAEFVGFKEGSYTIKETKTHSDYELAPDSIKIVNDGHWVNGAEGTDTKVVNYPEVENPDTGSTINYQAILLGLLALSVVATGIVVNKKIFN